jgi:hypothetical protein
MTGAMLSRSHRAVTYHREHCHAMPFSQAFHHFKYFFRQKTGIDWDQRLEDIKMSDEHFVYTPPILGRPVGFVCAGYVRPELRVRELMEGESEETGGESGESGDSERGEEVVYDTDSEVGDEDSEKDGGTITISSRSEESRAGTEEWSVLTISSDSRAASEERSVMMISSGSRAGSEDDEFGGGFGGSFDEMNSGMGSEGSGESEQTPTLTLGSQESDGLTGALEQVVRARTPPGLIYLSD